jgi:arylsulfatase A-like enzyme
MNVVLILADQLSAKWMGCYGNVAAHTPNLDRLAARGARFDNCIINHPVCMPSRASIITGRSAQHHGVYYNSFELGADLPTYPQMMQSAGMQTFGIGKFHLECHGRSAYNDVTKYGFDRAETTEDIREGEWLDWVREVHPAHYESALATVWTEMAYMEDATPERRALGRAIEAAREKHPIEKHGTCVWESVIPEEACQTRWVADRAMTFLDERDESKPFMLNLSFVDPHDPYDPPARFLEMIDPDAVPDPAASENAGLTDVLERFQNVPFVTRFNAAAPGYWRLARQHYLASLAFIDEQVGRLLDYLETSGLDKDTVIIFTSDHGDMLGDHNLPTKGAWHFDACIRVPLIISRPGIGQSVVGDTVTNLDIFPTLLDLAGVDEEVPLEGDSLVPLMQGNPLGRPDGALVETFGSYGNMEMALCARTVRTPEAALTLFGDGGGMLFDLEDDPDECVNLFDEPDAAPLYLELRDLMTQLEFRRYAPLSHRRRHPTALH